MIVLIYVVIGNRLLLCRWSNSSITYVYSLLLIVLVEGLFDHMPNSSQNKYSEANKKPKLPFFFVFFFMSFLCLELFSNMHTTLHGSELAVHDLSHGLIINSWIVIILTHYAFVFRLELQKACISYVFYALFFTGQLVSN